MELNSDLCDFYYVYFMIYRGCVIAYVMFDYEILAV